MSQLKDLPRRGTVKNQDWSSAPEQATCRAHPTELCPSTGPLGNPFPASAPETDSGGTPHACGLRPVVLSTSQRMSHAARTISPLDCVRQDPLLLSYPGDLVCGSGSSPGHTFVLHTCPLRTEGRSGPTCRSAHYRMFSRHVSLKLLYSSDAELSPASCPSATAEAELQRGAVVCWGQLGSAAPQELRGLSKFISQSTSQSA